MIAAKAWSREIDLTSWEEVCMSTQSEAPLQLLTLSCPSCKNKNVIKVERVIEFAQIKQTPLACVHCGKSWNQVLPGPLIAGPFRKTSEFGKLSRNRISPGHWTVTASKESITKEPETANLMLRLGAAANGILSAQRMAIIARNTPGMVGLRDLTWTFMMAVSQLKEAIDSLLKKNLDTIVENAKSGGATNEELMRLSELQSNEPDSLYCRVLRDTRDQITYHWDKEPFEAWVSKHDVGSVVWLLGEGQKERDLVYLASATAVTEAIVPGAKFQEFSQRMQEVLDWSGILAKVFQSAISGYLTAYHREIAPYPEMNPKQSSR